MACSSDPVTLTAGEMRAIFHVLRDIAAWMSIDDEAHKKRLSDGIIVSLRQVGSTLWEKVLSPEEWSVVQRTVHEECLSAIERV